MAIEYVGGKTVALAGSTSATTVSLTDLTGGLASAPAANDIVIVAHSVGAGGDRDCGVDTAGYTEEAELYSNGTLKDANLAVAWKRMGGTPDTDVVITTPNNTSNGQAVAIEVWRGVHTTTAMDVAAVTATGTGTAQADPPAITPTTAGAKIIAIGAGASNAGANFTTTGLDNFKSTWGDDNDDAIIGMGSRNWTGGSYNPNQFGGGTTAAGDSWAAVTLALRPAPLVLSCDAGAFTLTGASANLNKGSKVQADAASFALSGGAANLNRGSKLQADAAAFVLAAVDAGLLRGYPLAAASGSFAFTGAAAGLLYRRIMPADAGAFIFAGADAALVHGFGLPGDAGLFALGGADIAFRRTYVLAADAAGPELIANGTFDVDTTGWSIQQGGTIEAVSGVLRITNGAIGYTRAVYTFATEVGKRYTFRFDYAGGTASNFRVMVGLSANGNQYVDGYPSSAPASYTFSFVATSTSAAITAMLNEGAASVGKTAELDNFSVRESYAFVLTGANAALQYGRVMIADALGAEKVTNGTFNSNIASWTLYGNLTSQAWDAFGGGSYKHTRTGGVNDWQGLSQGLGLTAGKRYRVTGRNYRPTGSNATGRISLSNSFANQVDVTPASLDTWTPFSADMIAEGASLVTFSPSGAAGSVLYWDDISVRENGFALSGTAANLLRGAQLVAGVGAFSLTGAAAGLFLGLLLGAGTGAFALTGAAVSLLFGRNLIAEAGAFILTGLDAVLEVFRPITPSPSRSTYLLGRLADRITTLSSALRADRVTTLPTDRVVDRSTELTGE